MCFRPLGTPNLHNFKKRQRGGKCCVSRLRFEVTKCIELRTRTLEQLTLNHAGRGPAEFEIVDHFNFDAGTEKRETLSSC